MKLSEEKRMRATLPYGCWTEDDGAKVLFARDYRPMWKIYPDGKVSPDEGRRRRWGRTVNWVRMEHYFNDDNPPWRNKETAQKCKNILINYGIEEDFDHEH